MLYLAIGASWRLDAALVAYRTENLAYYARGAGFLTGRDPYGQGCIDLYREAGIYKPRRAQLTTSFWPSIGVAFGGVSLWTFNELSRP